MKVKSKIVIEDFKTPYGTQEYWVIWRVTGFADMLLHSSDNRRAAKDFVRKIEARAEAIREKRIEA